jgi:hypothetical protein
MAGGDEEMNLPWTTKELAILKAMREAGDDWPEISVATGHPECSCRTRANTEGIRKHKRPQFDRHTGITDDGPTLHHRSNGRPMAKAYEIRPCIGCRKLFKSWDRRKNQRCNRCAGISDSNMAF